LVPMKLIPHCMACHSFSPIQNWKTKMRKVTRQFLWNNQGAKGRIQTTTYWFASQNLTVDPSAVVIYRPSWLTSALVTGDFVSSVWTILPLRMSHNL
jgi:hypothetical protein